MTKEELFGLTDDEKRREHLPRPPVADSLEIEALRQSMEVLRNVNFVVPGGWIDGVYFENETISSVAAMQHRAGSLFSEMIQGKIRGYRVEMDRSVHPAAFHITTWA